MPDRAPLEGIAGADAHLGRPMPLPGAPLPLARWIEVVALGPDGVEVEWNLDDTRPGSPGRLALYAGRGAPGGERGLVDHAARGRYARRGAALAAAEPSLRPVEELVWRDDGLHLRLTAQGPWRLDHLLVIADSVGVGSAR
jgi:hypothetical protein